MKKIILIFLSVFFILSSGCIELPINNQGERFEKVTSFSFELDPSKTFGQDTPTFYISGESYKIEWTITLDRSKTGVNSPWYEIKLQNGSQRGSGIIKEDTYYGGISCYLAYQNECPSRDKVTIEESFYGNFSTNKDYLCCLHLNGYGIEKWDITVYAKKYEKR
jgi:hypothetical protein